MEGNEELSILLKQVEEMLKFSTPKERYKFEQWIKRYNKYKKDTGAIKPLLQER